MIKVRISKKGPNQETGVGNRGHLKVLNDTKLGLNDEGVTHANLLESFRNYLVWFDFAYLVRIFKNKIVNLIINYAKECMIVRILCARTCA